MVIRKIILVLLGILLFYPAKISAIYHYRPILPTKQPRPTTFSPTRSPRKWNNRPFKSPTPTITPSFTPTPTLSYISEGPYFKLELVNPSKPINVGNSFEVKILINTEGIETINGDALLNYDGTKLTINSAQSDNYYTFAFATSLGDNQYLVSSWEESIAHAKSSTSDTPFATLTITAKEQGLTSISFECTSGSEADSNINRASDSSDIIKCPIAPLILNIE